MVQQTPPMGWNSWNTFGENINEQLIFDTADRMVETGLRDAGYEYLVIDDCWSLKERGADGRIVPDPFKFPHGMKAVADYVHSKGLKFGIYLSPWDMHEETYGTRHYNDFFCRQLTELLSNYGEVFEVWLDGAKGADAKSFVYDWERYYKIIRTIQPMANIAICGPDIRWVGNEQAIARKSEYCVVPKMLTLAETLENKEESKRSGVSMLNSKSEDLGSREVLSQNAELAWYPAEVDVSIRDGWFYPGGDSVKSADKLFKIYLNSVGNNSFLLLNVPPTDKGVIHRKDRGVLKKLGLKLEDAFTEPVLSQSFDELKEGYVEFKFDSAKKLRYCVIEEDISRGQRIEKFDLYLEKSAGKYKKVYSGTVIGMKKIIKLKGSAEGAVMVIRQSRQAPVIQKIAFYD